MAGKTRGCPSCHILFFNGAGALLCAAYVSLRSAACVEGCYWQARLRVRAPQGLWRMRRAVAAAMLGGHRAAGASTWLASGACLNHQ